MELVYPTWDDFVEIAAGVLQVDEETINRVAQRPLAESALSAPRAGWEGYEQYKSFPTKAAVLLQRVVSNHALPDGNKRVGLLVAILFAHLNGYDWEPPQADDPDGDETFEVVIGAARRAVPVPALAAWIEDRLVLVPPPLPKSLADSPGMVIYPAEYVGELPYEDHSIKIGDHVIRDVHGYNPASIYVRRISGKAEAVTVAEIIISIVGDGYAQEELDALNAEAERYPLGQKEFWRARMVGNYLYGPDQHPMTNEDFEEEWAEVEDE
ncbi:Fic family protein [Micromonospora sp. PLK6-60]|uniref:type II toxin-antitoxin system death-on-curing family toxin n=1 Tax=Micromonospora sp. PLK6-60 TaxID=2873383 RepID=UPI001CA77020|nr:Fic family protein [Micromonospora sp. PLK6-60]MBY8872008.1 Fic family protein [Micromonospora sp. PLK6-60]